MAATAKDRLILFPTRIHQGALQGSSPGFLKQLLKECHAFRELDDSGQAWSKKNYYSGYTSYGSLCDLPERSPTFSKLKKALDRAVMSYARDLEMDLGRKKLKMSACWINIMGQGCYHAFHLHPLSTISGTFYLQVPKGSGAIKFEDPRLAMMMASPPRAEKARIENRRFVEIAPVPGEVVLFESWLKHEVPANRSGTERVSISFNYDWVS